MKFDFILLSVYLHMDYCGNGFSVNRNNSEKGIFIIFFQTDYVCNLCIYLRKCRSGDIRIQVHRSSG